MKPEDLKPPLLWEERKVHLEDGILYVPDYYDQYEAFTFPGWKEIFGNDAPVRVEYCTGHGHWLAEKARLEPHINWVAVEMRFDRIQRIWSKVKNHQLKNLFIVCGEAHLATCHYFPTGSVERAYINFPDPWPKNRHRKNRLIHDQFLEELNRVLIPGGDVTLATDDLPYMERFVKELATHPFKPRFEAPHFVTELEEYGGSWFEALWRGKGKTIHYSSYETSR